MKLTIKTHSKDETKALGAKLAPMFTSGDVVLLRGDLGAGKTTFVSGVAHALHTEDEVISPTFNIMKCYFKGSLPLYHIDAYRLEHQNIELGLDEYIEGDGVCFIEWPDYIAPLLPVSCLSLTLHNLGGDDREITFEGKGPHFEMMIADLEEKR